MRYQSTTENELRRDFLLMPHYLLLKILGDSFNLNHHYLVLENSSLILLDS